MIFGFEHAETQIPLDPAIDGFQLLAKDLLGIELGPMLHIRRERLIHPVHQVLRVFACEVRNRRDSVGKMSIAKKNSDDGIQKLFS
jgi:hypothetical protein